MKLRRYCWVRFCFSTSFERVILSLSKCRVGASAPRCLVVPSVTLAGGATSSPVLRVGISSTRRGCIMVGCRTAPGRNAFFSRSRRRMYCAAPVPNIENAGMSIQNHQPVPILVNASAIATPRKATPMKTFLMALSMFGSPRRRRRVAQKPPSSTSASSRACGTWPESAPETKLIFAPQTRQKLTSSRFLAAQFGQNILIPPIESRIQRCRNLIQRCKNSIKVCKVPIQPCTVAIQGCKESIKVCKVAIQRCKDPIQRCKQSVKSCKVPIQRCKNSILSCEDLTNPCKIAIQTTPISNYLTLGNRHRSEITFPTSLTLFVSTLHKESPQPQLKR